MCLVQLFVTKMLQHSFQAFVATDVNAFRAFQQLFLDANVCCGKIVWINKDNLASLSPLDFEVLQLDVVGYDALWSIVLDASHTEVVESAIELLNKLHENVSQAMKKTVGALKLREEFIVSCLVCPLLSSLSLSPSSSSFPSSSSIIHHHHYFHLR
jgi:hypothetical protein